MGIVGLEGMAITRLWQFKNSKGRETNRQRIKPHIEGRTEQVAAHGRGGKC